MEILYTIGNCAILIACIWTISWLIAYLFIDTIEIIKFKHRNKVSLFKFMKLLKKDIEKYENIDITIVGENLEACSYITDEIRISYQLTKANALERTNDLVVIYEDNNLFYYVTLPELMILFRNYSKIKLFRTKLLNHINNSNKTNCELLVDKLKE